MNIREKADDRPGWSKTWPVHDAEGTPVHPAFTDPTFDHVNDMVHHPDTGFEDLQALCLGMATRLKTLASIPEDEGLAVDEDFLRSLGAHIGKTCVTFQKVDEGHRTRRTLSVVTKNGDAAMYVSHEDEDGENQLYFPLPDLKTRGAVRRLLGCLGILQERKGSRPPETVEEQT